MPSLILGDTDPVIRKDSGILLGVIVTSGVGIAEPPCVYSVGG